ncbi:carboxypeptidase-like protein [Ulvibacter sp. MAR_2010_11]|uniref:carboxypeptidase-like regulatory domain-containing protein n=1 Tax=Ulvibacter sp. MAR_2010_11 TaxID=1250229 RepID=UPI000C2BC909|nr:carboxypeptidase-like regulatory domain-containing protein [Ulvibacter sp. MAR_2010_11]PKA83651.1 carboxypeptidase-like protein [Ulvibacter sp. MAR_2010_11]
MKHSFLKYFFGLLIGLSCLNAVAQTELKGKITDFATYEPIESASIYIKNTTVGTVSNVDGKFVLLIPDERVKDTLVISSIGYKSFVTAISDFDTSGEIFLEEDIASLDEVVLISDPRPTTGNEIVLKALKKLPQNLPEQPYLQKGFLRHKERNKKEYKWLIESALTLYDSSFASGAEDNLKLNIDETRKSYDLRDVDSLFAFSAYLKSKNIKPRDLSRNTVKKDALIEAIKWNDGRVNGLDNLFMGRLNLVRNSNMKNALFGENILEKHQFELDTVLVDDGRKLYKIKITKGKDYIGLNTKNIYNDGYNANGWLYIYWDNYAFKKIEYELVAASPAQKSRSKSLFDTQVNHKLIITYIEYDGKMYPNYFYYETPKLVNVGDRSSDKDKKEESELRSDREQQFYYTVQEILFTEIIRDQELIDLELKKDWSEDIFLVRPYNKEFWKKYNVLLESEEEEKLIHDLSQRASLFKQ